MTHEGADAGAPTSADVGAGGSANAPLPRQIGEPIDRPAQGADARPAFSKDDRLLLEGPHSRVREFLTLFRAMRDFLRGFRALHFVGPCITIFGSARLGESHPYYALTRQLASRISGLGFTVMTGGGPGLMEAANRGAMESGGLSVACNIERPSEQRPNPYLHLFVTCHHFFVRKVLLFKYSYGFVAMPGGLGTLDELTEALTLIQTKKIRNFPVVLIGTEYWKPFIALLTEMVQQGAVAPEDLNLLKLTDRIDEAIVHIEEHTVIPFGLRRVMKPAWWLGERRVGPGDRARNRVRA
jgi:uncharacterized protein (TIGR00730 family)